MTNIVWDETGKRIYEIGIDRGVLYLMGVIGVPWNGLVSLEETSKKSTNSVYVDGIKISDKLEEGIKSISIGSFQAFLSAYSNDVDWEMAYAQFLYVMGSKGDVIIGISCSGNAKNVLNAFKVAKVKGIYSILLTGENEGICVNYCDLCIKVPERDTYRIQEYHSMIYHAVCAEVERRIFSE